MGDLSNGYYGGFSRSIQLIQHNANSNKVHCFVYLLAGLCLSVFVEQVLIIFCLVSFKIDCFN